MIEVLPLKFGASFKKIFSEPTFFNNFASDVLGIPLNIEQVYTEYEYPEPIGFVRSKYDLFAEDEKQRIIIEIQNVKEDDFFDRFLYYHLISLVEQVKGYKEYCFDRTVYTIVVLTSIPRNNTINFSYAISDYSPINEYGQRVSVYPHRLIFLAPRLENNNTPPKIQKWLKFIKDSLDGKMNETKYQEEPFLTMMKKLEHYRTNPGELAAIKDEMAWEKARLRFIEEGKIEGKAEGKIEGETVGQANALLHLLERRFDVIPQEISNKIKEASLVMLEKWFDKAISVKTIDAIFLAE